MIIQSKSKIAELYRIYYHSEDRKNFKWFGPWLKHYGGELITDWRTNNGEIMNGEIIIFEDEQDYIIFKLKIGV